MGGKELRRRYKVRQLSRYLVFFLNLFAFFSDVFQALRQEFEDEACAGLCEAVTRHLHEAEAAHATAGADGRWWKTVEASLLALGVVKDLLIGHMKVRPISNPF